MPNTKYSNKLNELLNGVNLKQNKNIQNPEYGKSTVKNDAKPTNFTSDPNPSQTGGQFIPCFLHPKSTHKAYQCRDITQRTSLEEVVKGNTCPACLP